MEKSNSQNNLSQDMKKSDSQNNPNQNMEKFHSQKHPHLPNLLDIHLLKDCQPNKDLLEVVDEIQSDEKPSVHEEHEGHISLQFKETKSMDARQLAQIPESSSPSDSPELETEEIEEIDERNSVKNNSNLKSLMHESVFQREYAKRDLDVYVEDQAGLSLQDVEVQEDFGNVEVRWKPPEDLN